MDAATPFDTTELTTVDLYQRPSKVAIDDLGQPGPIPGIGRLLDLMPHQLAANTLRRIVFHLVRIRRDQHLAIAALGGHVIKTGCGPYLIDWMNQGVLGAVALNGAAAIHDAELALAGKTSEDVGPRLLAGSFGMATQTAELHAAAARRAERDGIGLGQALGAELDACNPPHADRSVVLQAYRLGVPCTVSVAMGTDVVHMHPCVQQVAGAFGAASMLDFRRLNTLVCRLEHGLWLNIGCAVILPEVFLKAVAIARNFGHTLDGMVTANLDMIQQYRGRVNVCDRPGQEGLALTGHHEINIPLLHALVAAELHEGCRRGQSTELHEHHGGCCGMRGNGQAAENGHAACH